MYHVTKNTGLDEIKGAENILYHMHHVKPILLVWLLALWEGCVDAEKHIVQ